MRCESLVQWSLRFDFKIRYTFKKNSETIVQYSRNYGVHKSHKWSKKLNKMQKVKTIKTLETHKWKRGLLSINKGCQPFQEKCFDHSVPWNQSFISHFDFSKSFYLQNSFELSSKLSDSSNIDKVKHYILFSTQKKWSTILFINKRKSKLERKCVEGTQSNCLRITIVLSKIQFFDYFTFSQSGFMLHRSLVTLTDCRH